jgi:hypothetical protein
MILPVEQRHADIRFAKCFRGFESGESSADDDDAGQIAMMDFHKAPAGSPSLKHITRTL